MTFEGQRILADEQAFVAFESHDEVAGAVAHQAGVGGDTHERSIE